MNYLKPKRKSIVENILMFKISHIDPQFCTVHSSFYQLQTPQSIQHFVKHGYLQISRYLLWNNNQNNA